VAVVSEEVLQFLTDIRSVVEKERGCSGMWHHSIFKGFAKLSRDRSEKAQQIVREIIVRREALSRLSRRIEALLHKASVARSSGSAFALQNVEEVLTVVLAQQARKNKLKIDLLDEIDALGAVGLVEAFAAARPGGQIDAIELAAGDGAALMKDIVIKHEWREDTCLLLAFAEDVIKAGYDSQTAGNDTPCIHYTMHKLLSCPGLLPLVFRFVKSGEISFSELGSFSITNLFRSAIGFVDNSDDDDDDDDDSHDEGDDAGVASEAPKKKSGMSIRDALACCGSEYREDTIQVLEQAVAQNLCIKMEDRDFVPDGFRSPVWYRLAIPEIESAILATGLYSRRAAAPNANESSNQNEVPQTQAAAAQAIESALVTLSKHSWLVRNTWNSRHPFARVKNIAVHLLVVGEHLAAAVQRAGDADFGGAAAIAARSRNHWKSIFKTDGPPEDCAEGYHGCDYDGSCFSCGMPREYCPSLFRLRVEIREFMARMRNDGAIDEVEEVAPYDATAVVTTIRGGYQYPDAPSIVQEAAAAMVAAGLLQKNRFSWSFTGSKRPVCFTSPDLRTVVLNMRPIT
jgi:hypothetical protein